MQEPLRVHSMNLQTPPVRSPYTSTQAPYQRPLPLPPRAKKASLLFPVLAILVLVGGTASGFGLSKLGAKELASLDGGAPSGVVQQVATGKVNNGDVFGSQQDASSFKDTAEGYLQIGGIDGEGSHKILRDGGPSQTVYLTSTSTDLDQMDGMRVKVWGETFKGQKAGWLMDVVRIQIVDKDATPPTWVEAKEGSEAGE